MVRHGLNHSRACGERTDAGLDPVGDDERLVHAEQCGQLGLVGLELVPGGPDGSVLVGWVFEFDDGEEQAVDEEHNVWAAFVLVFGDGELVDGEPVVGGRIFEVDDRAPAHRGWSRRWMGIRR